MKILILSHEFPPYRGGVASYTFELAKSAQKLGHDITVVAPNYYKDTRDFDSQQDIKIIRYNARQYSSKNLFKVLIRTLYFLKHEKYDIFHATDFAYLIGVSFWRKFFNIKYVVTVYGSELLQINNSKHLKILNLRFIFKFPLRIFAISEYTKKLLLKNCPYINEKKIIVTPLGVDSYWMARNLKTNQLKIIKNKKFIITTVSRIDRRKGHIFTIYGLMNLKDEIRKRIVYIIVGVKSDINYYQELTELSEKVDFKIIFTGAISKENLRKIYSNTYLFSMPGQQSKSTVEGFGLTYLEAGAQGVPSIATSIGASSEIVLDGLTGFIVNDQDIKHLTTIFEKLFLDIKFRNRMGQNAYEFSKKFSWSNCADITYNPF